MECNKEEAFRAKRMAEKKMENKDILKARKIAIQAQKLYPELENILQLIMVCDVHCSAENKVHGTEMDWYGILKVEPTADDLLIRKQSRKFGLLLHPDKNKFPGAADAFKLIGEAQSVLLDQKKRWIYDMKCISAAVNVQQPTGHAKSSVNANKQFQQAPQTDQTGFNSSRPTFWTACPFCSMRHQYYRDMLNKNVTCQTCGKSFIGTDISTPGVALHNNWSLLAVPKQTEADNQAPSEVDQQSNAENFTKIKAGENSRSSDTPKGSKLSERFVDVSKNCDQKRKAETPLPRGKMNEKKRKQVSESSKSCNSNSPTFWTACPSCYVLYQFCRNVLQKNLCCQNCEKVFTAYEIGTQGVAPKNNSSQSAFPKQTGAPNQAPSEVGSRSNAELATTEVEVGRNIWSSEDAKTEPKIIEYPDSDFRDFDKNREEKRFAAGQIWAVYDTWDVMPRFYAQISEVFHPKFKLRITWLEADPDDKDEIKWAEQDLPVSCGNFKQGKSENIDNRLMFSHLVSWEKGSSSNTCKIYPRKGETWALFKNWNINWSSDPENHRKYEYDIVEVLSEYVDGTAISVAYLGKVKGYVCIFCRKKQGVDIFQIEPKEIFRFSHRIPSFQMTGEKVIDALVGSFELDPGCLPPNLQEIDPPTLEEMKSKKTPLVGPCSTFATNTDVSKNQAEQKKRSDSRVHLSVDEEDRKLQYDASFNMFKIPTEVACVVPDLSKVAYEIPLPEFHNFDADKLLEKFEIGQVWAIYCDEDGMPKYYAKIKKIDILPKLRLTVAWLGVSSIYNGMILWIDKSMPITCGKFKLRKREPSEYTNIYPFSHQVSVRVESRGTKEEYVILPRKGEIWALYKSWNAGMKCSDLETCEYDVVEVIEENQSGTTVFFLEKVDGFTSVYRAQVEGYCLVTFKIPANELLRFSHQIPAFRLTEERGGSLRGYLELDPAALPLHWFSKN